MRWIADFLYLMAGLLYLPVAAYQAIVLGKNRRGWSERFGGVCARDPDRPRIWIHAVSLGEVNCTPRLIASLRSQLANCDIVISTTTDTGYARAVSLYGADQVFRFPLDFSLVVGRVLNRVRPSLIVLVELEVWFNLVHESRNREIPVVVVNGRLTTKSASRFRYLGSAGRSMFAGLSWVCAQDESIASRFRELGVGDGRLTVTGSLKWDSADIVDKVDGSDALARSLGLTAPVWVCGSTGPGEEALILDVYRRLLDDWNSASRPALALVPRKPERFDEVAGLIVQHGFRCIRRSAQPAGASAPDVVGEASVVLGDTMGELRKFYACADVVFVGRSLVPLGGSDPMEVAALARPMIVGPHMENFQSPVEAFRKAGALSVVTSRDQLLEGVRKLLIDPEAARRMGALGREVVVEHQGATEKTVQELLRFFR